jgi:predicted nuclease of predicted toxin-antitoxin system
MKFLVDAQLPFRLALFLETGGHDVLHTDDLPDKERTSDTYLRELSIRENRILITKDYDFLDSFYLTGKPWKLLLITAGNIRNTELISLFQNNLQKITELFRDYSFVELNNLEIIGHE